jgi:DNA-binding transcriptional LysR family regulator
VARLEERLGVRLFHRSTRSMTLTAEGMMLLERSRRVLAEIEAAEQELSQSASVPKGRLRVSLPLVSGLVLPVLADFMRAYPAVELDLSFTDRMVDVVEEGYDAVVRTGELLDSRLSSRQLGSFGTVIVASPAYFAQHGVPQRPADLAGHPCLHYRFPNSGKLEVWPLLREAGEPEPRLPTSMICDNAETRVWFALQGLGIACLPAFAVRAELAAGALRTVLDEYVDRTITFRLLWPSGRHLTPRLRAFIDFMAERGL